MPQKILRGLDQFHYALLNYDTSAGVSYQTPAALNGALRAAINTNSDVETLPSDDGIFDAEDISESTDIDVEVKDMSQEDYAAIFGHTITGGVLDEKANDRSAEVAFGFRAKRSNGGYSYYWYLKGKFAKPSMEHQSKGSWQYPTISGKFIDRINDSRRKRSTRDDADDYTADIGTNWFASVYGTTADATAPTFVSSIPVSGSATATQTSNIVITFSEPILSSTVTAANFIVLRATANLTMSAALSVSSAIVTIATSAVLTATASYNVILNTGIKDYAGNSLSGIATFRFTTTA
jgi:phi13 family phage major tail protein